MLQNSIRTFYAAMRGQQYIGIFSSPEKAQTAAYDTLTEINPFLMNGTSPSEEYVCMAKGCCAMPVDGGDFFEITYLPLEPSWGLNPQSSFFGLCGANLERKNVLVSGFYLFEVDRAYAADELCSIHEASAFSRFSGRTYDYESFEEHFLARILKRDYIRMFLSEQSSTYVPVQKNSSAESLLLADRLMQIACDRVIASDRSISCGFGVSQSRQTLNLCLFHRFTAQELHRLCVLLRLREPNAEVPMPEEAVAAALFERVKPYIPPIFSTRPLKDYLD